MTVSVFDTIEQCTDDEVARLVPLVSSQRRDQALKFKFTAGRYACLKSYLMLHDILADLGVVATGEPLTFDYNPYGKPLLRNNPSIHFSISHCPKAIAVAVSDQPVGIDVERFHAPDAGLLRKTMNASEQASITQSENPSETFTLLWTQKEALLKFQGTGINCELTDVLVNPCALIESHVVAAKQYVWSSCYDER